MITHTGGGMKPKRLWEEESPRFAYQTGFTDENPQSVTVTFTQKYKYLGKTKPLGQHGRTAAHSRELHGVHGSGLLLGLNVLQMQLSHLSK